jgi:glycosyltransferase involved in cell wall biosynthesis
MDVAMYAFAVTLSVVIITHNEEANLGRTLESVMPLLRDGKGEIIVVDSGSTDRTVEIAKSFGGKVFFEEWKGFAAQKNSAIDKASGDWILSLDADEEISSDLASEITKALADQYLRETNQGIPGSAGNRLRAIFLMQRDSGIPLTRFTFGYWFARKNFFLGRWIKHGGFWPDYKMRLFRQGAGQFEDRAVHEDVLLDGPLAKLDNVLLHHSYPTLSDYIEHMNRYSSLGAEMVVAEGKGRARFSLINILFRPLITFIYNYFLRLGFLDGREGLLLHLYHAVYVSWKYSKAWEFSHRQRNERRKH